jgi:hypothetical protein
MNKKLNKRLISLSKSLVSSRMHYNSSIPEEARQQLENEAFMMYMETYTPSKEEMTEPEDFEAIDCTEGGMCGNEDLSVEDQL